MQTLQQQVSCSYYVAYSRLFYTYRNSWLPITSGFALQKSKQCYSKLTYILLASGRDKMAVLLILSNILYNKMYVTSWGCSMRIYLLVQVSAYNRPNL